MSIYEEIKELQAASKASIFECKRSIDRINGIIQDITTNRNKLAIDLVLMGLTEEVKG